MSGGARALLKATEANENIDIVVGAFCYENEQGQQISPFTRPSLLRCEASQDPLIWLLKENRFPVHAVITKRRLIDEANGFDESLSACEDWDLWLRLVTKGAHLEFIDLPVAKYRRHSDCMTLDWARMEKGFLDVIHKFFKDQLKDPALNRIKEHAIFTVFLRLARYCQEANDKERLREYLNKGKEQIKRLPFDENFFIPYFFLPESLPEAELLARELYKQFPESEMLYKWSLMAMECKKKRYLPASELLLLLLVHHPIWTIQKIRKTIT